MEDRKRGLSEDRKRGPSEDRKRGPSEDRKRPGPLEDRKYSGPAEEERTNEEPETKRQRTESPSPALSQPPKEEAAKAGAVVTTPEVAPAQAPAPGPTPTPATPTAPVLEEKDTFSDISDDVDDILNQEVSAWGKCSTLSLSPHQKAQGVFFIISTKILHITPHSY